MPFQKGVTLFLPHQNIERQVYDMSKQITFGSLRRFNLIMGFLHLIQGLLMLGFALFIDRIAEFRVPVMSYFLSFDIPQMRLVTEPSQLGELPFGITVSLFLFLSALAHFIIVSPWGNKIYNRDLEKGMNRF